MLNSIRLRRLLKEIDWLFRQPPFNRYQKSLANHVIDQPLHPRLVYACEKVASISLCLYHDPDKVL